MQVAMLADAPLSPDLYQRAVRLFLMARYVAQYAKQFGNVWSNLPRPWSEPGTIKMMTELYQAVATALGREEHRTRDLAALTPETAAVFAFSLVGNADENLRWIPGSALQAYLERGLPGAAPPGGPSRGLVLTLVTLGIIGAGAAGFMIARSQPAPAPRYTRR